MAIASAFLCTVTVAALSSCESPPEGGWIADVPDVRARFFEAISRIEPRPWLGDDVEATTAVEVRAILGDPDDIITQIDPVNIGIEVKEVWCYGTNGHLTLPTLGSVSIDMDDRVWFVEGATERSQLDGSISEERLRELLRTIHRTPDGLMWSKGFDPREMIHVVNSLRELGKDQALAILREYARIRSTHWGLDGGVNTIVIMRFLFEVPKDRLHHTTYLPFEEYKNPSFPAFPAVVIEGAPLLLFPLGGFGIGGGMPTADEYLDWYAEHGVMRGEPLRPNDDPRVIWQAYHQGLHAQIAADNAQHAAAADRLVREQMLRLIDTIHQRGFDDDVSWRRDIPACWLDANETLDRTPTRWNTSLEFYVRDDGSYIEPTPEPLYKRAVWTLPIKGRVVCVILHRMSEETIVANLQQSAHDGPVVPNMTVRICRADDLSVELASMMLDGAFTSGASSSMRSIDVDKGVRIRMFLLVDGQVVMQSEPMSLDEEVRVGE